MNVNSVSEDFSEARDFLGKKSTYDRFYSEKVGDYFLLQI